MSTGSADELAEFYDAHDEHGEGIEEEDVVDSNIEPVDDRKAASMMEKLEEAIEETIEEALFNEDPKQATEGNGGPVDYVEEQDKHLPRGSSQDSSQLEDYNAGQLAEEAPTNTMAAEIEKAVDKIVGEAMLNEQSDSTSTGTKGMATEGPSYEVEEVLVGGDNKDNTISVPESSFEEQRSKQPQYNNGQRKAKKNGSSLAAADKDDEPSSQEQKLSQVSKPTPSPPPTSHSTPSGWKGMFSALSSIRERLYDALDPNLPEDDQMAGQGTRKEEVPAQGEKSIKSLFEKLSPEADASPSRGGWMDEFDKTFDFASDKIGQALLGGLKTLENTVGISIEPISSPTNSQAGSGAEEEQDDAGKELDAIDEAEPKPTVVATEGSSGLGKNIYSAGLNTLERLGRTTAGIVVSTKERLTPIIRQGGIGLGLGVGGGREETLTRQDLKRAWEDIFNELSGNDALEKLQVKSATASVELKKRLKALNPKQLAKMQGELKVVGSKLDSLREAELNWNTPIMVAFAAGQEEFIEKLQRSISMSLERIGDPEASIGELGERVDSPLPVDTPTLLIYLIRANLANILSASLHILLCIDYDKVSCSGMEDQVITLVMQLYGAVSRMQTLIETPLIDASRRVAISKVISDDCAAARSIFSDAALMLQPALKLSKYNHLDAS